MSRMAADLKKKTTTLFTFYKVGFKRNKSFSVNNLALRVKK